MPRIYDFRAEKRDMPKTMQGQQDPSVFYPDSASSYLAEEKKPSAKNRESRGNRILLFLFELLF
jgi:hypothetical protein